MNRRQALMTLLVIALVAGPFLFDAPPVIASPSPTYPVLVRIGGNIENTLTEGPGYEDDLWIDDWFLVTELTDPPPFPDPSWKPVGKIYDVTLNDENDIRKTALLALLNTPIPDENGNDIYPEVEILLLVANKYKNKPEGLYIVQYAQFCDFDDDGEVTGHDTRLISTHMNNPGTYTWEYDLNYDNEITVEDIHIADSYKGTYEQWITLPIPETRIVIVDSNPYLIAELWHFSGFGIRR